VQEYLEMPQEPPGINEHNRPPSNVGLTLYEKKKKGFVIEV
jgi:hypothetical protein